MVGPACPTTGIDGDLMRKLRQKGAVSWENYPLQPSFGVIVSPPSPFWGLQRTGPVGSKHSFEIQRSRDLLSVLRCVGQRSRVRLACSGAAAPQGRPSTAANPEAGAPRPPSARSS